MDNNQRKVLEMLAEKKISVDEAARLLSVLKPEGEAETSGSVPAATMVKVPKYLRVEVRPNPNSPGGPADVVNIRVPMALLRAGIKLASVLPPKTYEQVDAALKEKGVLFDLRNIKPENLEEIASSLNDLEVDVHNGQQTVHIYAE